MDKIRIALGNKGQFVFEREYDSKNADSARAMVLEYRAFYTDYRSKHIISARKWNFPPVLINGVQKYVVTPNGSWYDNWRGKDDAE